jgi:UDP:flavonoid glycosyltransferase YjiC (YdhE family)
MRVLLSTIGSRGDVQPLVALGLQVRALGQEVRLCVASAERPTRALRLATVFEVFEDEADALKSVDVAVDS